MQRVMVLVAGMLLVLAGCRSTYYGAWEKLGWEKRDLLSDAVTDARDEQQKASKEFKTTLERFKELTSFQGGELESRYNTLKAQYDSCESRAGTVMKRINEVETVAKDMFSEWEQELKQYQNASLRSSSEKKLNQTKTRYGQLISVMRKAESRMGPVLGQFKDQVLYVKHNLNAQAIASLQGTSSEIEVDVNKLIAEMDAAIAEANEFVGTLK